MTYVKKEIIELVNDLLINDKEYNIYVAKKLNSELKDEMTQIIIYNKK